MRLDTSMKSISTSELRVFQEKSCS